MKTTLKRPFSCILALAMMIALLTACGSSDTSSGSASGTTSGTASGASSAASSSGTSAASASGEAIVIKFADVVADDHPYNMGANKFKELLETSAANAGYNVSVDIYANSALGGERELAESLQLGTCDIAIIPGVINSFYAPMGVFDLPYLFESTEQAYEILDGEIGTEVASGMPEECGFRLLAYWENGYRNMTNSKRAISSPDDVKGLTMRVPENSVYVAFFEACGANVITMSFSELYTALQQKTVDGQENPIALIATNKLYETQKYLSRTEHFYGAAQVCISETLWQSLPADLQGLVQDAANEARDYERQCCADMVSTYLKEIEDYGTAVNDVDKSLFQDAANQVYEKFADQYGDLVARIKEAK